MNNKINCFSISTIIISICNSIFYGTFSSYILNKTKNDSIITIIIGFIFSLLLSTIMIKLFNKYQNISYIQKNKKIFKKTSFIFSIIIIICSFISYTLLTYRLSSFLSNQYLTQTSDYIILIMILFITYYISSKDIETTLRVSTITFFISIIIFIFDFISLFNQIKINNFFPIFTINYKTIIKTSILFSLNFTIPLIYINVIKKNDLIDKNKFNKYYYLSIIISFLIILTNLITTIGVSGIEINNLFDYPIYTTLKRIKLFSFLDSLENISIMLWILFIINTCSIILLFIKKNIKELFNINPSIIMIVLVIISFLIPTFLLNNLYIESSKYVLIPSLIHLIILLIQIISIIKNKLSHE